jgi:GH15 family glucan-1,4-alpha-glucosidase
MVFAAGSTPGEWSIERARHTLTSALAYWRRWYGQLEYAGAREKLVKRSATIIHLLGYVPTGSLMAAPTPSLPKRIGGERNYDYRYAWVRDASVAISTLIWLGHKGAAAHYLHWLARLPSGYHGPLRMLYHVSDSTDV